MSAAQHSAGCEAWHDVGAATDFLDGVCATVRVGGAVIAILRRGDVWTAFDDRCPHKGDPLHEGILVPGAVACRAHGWSFSLDDGRCTAGDREARLGIHGCRIAAGRVLVRTPAEFPPARPRL